MLRYLSSGEHGIKLPRTQRREGMCPSCCQSFPPAKRRISCSTAVVTTWWLFPPPVGIWTQGDPGLPGPPGPPGQVGEQSRQPETEIQRGDKVIFTAQMTFYNLEFCHLVLPAMHLLATRCQTLPHKVRHIIMMKDCSSRCSIPV